MKYFHITASIVLIRFVPRLCVQGILYQQMHITDDAVQDKILFYLKLLDMSSVASVELQRTVESVESCGMNLNGQYTFVLIASVYSSMSTLSGDYC